MTTQDDMLNFLRTLKRMSIRTDALGELNRRLEGIAANIGKEVPVTGTSPIESSGGLSGDLMLIEHLQAYEIERMMAVLPIIEECVKFMPKPKRATKSESPYMGLNDCAQLDLQLG